MGDYRLKIQNMLKLTNLARENRKNPTDSEKKLYYTLRNLKIGRFQRQFPINDKYIVDLIWRERRLIIECDGIGHHTDKGLKYDKERTEFLQKQGYKILRFDNNDIMKNIDWVLNEILSQMNQ